MDLKAHEHGRMYAIAPLEKDIAAREGGEVDTKVRSGWFRGCRSELIGPTFLNVWGSLHALLHSRILQPVVSQD